MGVPPEGFLPQGSEPESAAANRPLPAPYEATWREGGDGSAMSSVALMPHVERTVAAAEADVELGIAGNGGRQLVATVRRVNAYGSALIDSFEGAGETTPIGPEDFYFGRSGGNDILRYGDAFRDDGQQVVLRLTPRSIAPAGVRGEVLYRNLYLTLSYGTGFKVVVTPVVDGERLTAEATTIEEGASVDTSQVFEIPLAEDQDPGTGATSRRGVRGTWFTFDLEGEDVLRVGGDLTVENVELEYEIIRESHPARSFAVESLDPISLSPPGRFYIGEAGGNGLLRAMDGADDAGSPIDVLAQPNEVAPAGASGECVFANLYLTFTRANSSDLDLTVEPILDRTALDPISLTLPGVADPVTEVHELPLTRPVQSGGQETSRRLPRGTWFSFRIKTVAGTPAERVVLEGNELEYEVVRESEEAADAG